jgi:hypothetical protein
MIDDISHQIKLNKEKLRKKSKSYNDNFQKIENFIRKEVYEIQKLKKNSERIIPEISFKKLSKNIHYVEKLVRKRGCIIIRDVFDDNRVLELDESLENYIVQNNYYEHQKEKAGLDNYFSNLKSAKPQIYGLYWSNAQLKIRHSEEMQKVKAFLNNLWIYENDEYKVFDPNRELCYADRVRRREPGDNSLGLTLLMQNIEIEQLNLNLLQ